MWLGGLIVGLMIATTVCSQVPDHQKDDSVSRQLAWDVISIKPDNSLGIGGSMYMRPDGVEVKNLTIQSLFWSAFDIKSQDQVVGLPNWADSDHFDIQAKVGPDDVYILRSLKPDQRRLLWREILDKRFSLKFHLEKRKLPVYNLVVMKKGPKLNPSSVSNSLSNYSSGKISAQGTPVASLVVNLSGVVGRLVIDKTDLTGRYDFELTWSPNNQPDSGPSIFTALQEQLGLKLEPAKEIVDVVVVDHLEHPSPN
jgi:uncharacterized protein (TIGR03435 family)